MLVITAAGHKELSVDWLRSCNIPVLSIKDVPSFKHGKHTVVCVITGCGSEASEFSAQLIQGYFTPEFVLNVGTVGATSELAIGSPVIAKTFISKNNPDINFYNSFPFPDFNTKRVVIETVPEPLYSIRSNDILRCFDMESYLQAKAFKAADTPFYAYKIVSDHINSDTKESYKLLLPTVQRKIKDMLSFLSYSKPLISVVIPVYNRPTHILNAIESVKTQSFAAYEIIVVDDGSTDSTLVEIEKMDDITLLKHDKNKGVSTARNTGIKASKGNWIAFLDSDDIWLRDKLKNQVKYLIKNPYYLILQSQEKWIRNGAHLNQKKYHQKHSGYIWDMCLARCMISPSSVMIHRSLIDCGYVFDESLVACEDFDLWLRICRYHAVGLDESVTLVKYGGHSDQLSTQINLDYYRIQALLKAYETEESPRCKELLQLEIDKRFDILQKGSIKHNNTSMLKSCQSLYTQFIQLN